VASRHNSRKLTLYTLPDISTVLDDIGDWATPVLNALVPLAVAIVGITIGGIIAAFIVTIFISGVRMLFARKSDETALAEPGYDKVGFFAERFRL